MKNAIRFLILCLTLHTLLPSAPAHALERLCQVATENCRGQILKLITNETVGIDIGMWYMTDSSYSSALIRKFQAGVPVRVIADTRSYTKYPATKTNLELMAAAGIPIRTRITGGIMHWKYISFAGQKTVEFGSANFNAWTYTYLTAYIAESMYFTDDPSIVQSLQTAFDDLWVDKVRFANFGNAATPVRAYPVTPLHPDLNLAYFENLATRCVAEMDAEPTSIDVNMFRITDTRYMNGLLNAMKRGVKVRLLTEQVEYRNTGKAMQAFVMDTLLGNGAEVKVRAHQGMNHEKLMLLSTAKKAVFGSSNWSDSSTFAQQDEINYFTTKPEVYSWFVSEFDWKWNTPTQSMNHVPQPPNTPSYKLPANLSTAVSPSGLKLQWNGGYWATKYDIYFGTTSNPPLAFADVAKGTPGFTGTSFPAPNGQIDAGTLESFTIPAGLLLPGATYYWKVVAKTPANVTKTGPIWKFTTAVPATVGAKEVVLHASSAISPQGWNMVMDQTAASGYRMENPNKGVPKLASASASPTAYFELSFYATAGTPYHLWIRGKAASNSTANDSVFIQFSGAVDAAKTPLYPIGTNVAGFYSVQDSGTAGLSGWGWNDQAYGSMGAPIYFTTTGLQTIRIQQREDGISIDQIVLSPSKYLNTAPGWYINDTLTLPASTGE